MLFRSAAVFLPDVPEEPKELFEVTSKKGPAVGQRSGTKGSSQNNQELFCQRFQHFCYKETPGPHEALSQLWVFCCEWLRPEIHTKEQMLDLLVLEQFLTILPEELQDWAQEHQPESGGEAVALLEDLERDLDESGQQVGKGPMLSGGIVGSEHPSWSFVGSLGIIYSVGPSDA